MAPSRRASRQLVIERRRLVSHFWLPAAVVFCRRVFWWLRRVISVLAFAFAIRVLLTCEQPICSFKFCWLAEARIFFCSPTFFASTRSFACSPANRRHEASAIAHVGRRLWLATRLAHRRSVCNSRQTREENKKKCCRRRAALAIFAIFLALAIFEVQSRIFARIYAHLKFSVFDSRRSASRIQRTFPAPNHRERRSA